jgi:hypothetical protein
MIGEDRVAEAMEICLRDDRVCPGPIPWHEFWKFLCSQAARAGIETEPPKPNILSAWWYSNDAEKRARVRDQLVWACDHKLLDEAVRFLSDLPDHAWHPSGGSFQSL